ncbi:hypothetical protein OAV46_05345 [Euryarchaeota archaeon]|nr:hypothetical protein [Euryarchaeota archaeon]
MRIIAPMMILIMMTSTLAGCTGGDPDGGGEIDTDAVNNLIDQNLQDFINNTTITVNQEIHNHYHNNTTIVSNDYTTEYNNTTVNEGDSIVNEGDDNNLNEWSNTSYNLGGAEFGNGVNGTVYAGSNMMFVAHLEFDAHDIFPNLETEPGPDRDSIFTYTWEYYDYLTNSNRTDIFTFSCQVFYLVGSQSNNGTNSTQVSFFNDSDNYANAWSNEYNNTIAEMLTDAGQNPSIRSICDEEYITSGAITLGEDGFEYTFFSIDVPIGYAIQYIQLDHSHSYYGCSQPIIYSGGCLNTQDSSSDYRQNHYSMQYNYSSGPHPSDDNYYGGWDDLTIDFDLAWRDTYSQYDWEYGSPTQYSYVEVGYGSYAVWDTSEYEFTLYYQFVPVIPTE